MQITAPQSAGGFCLITPVDHPGEVSAIITQKGNAYEVGFVDDFWAPIWASTPSAGSTPTASPTRPSSARTPGTTTRPCSRGRATTGQLDLFADYTSNRALYPRVHQFLRAYRLPVLAVWGRHDEIFGPDGARAFTADAPDTEVHLLEGGHFLLETHLDDVASLVQNFLMRRVATLT